MDTNCKTQTSSRPNLGPERGSQHSWLLPGSMSKLLSCSVDVRFGGRKSAIRKNQPQEKNGGLSTREGSKMILGI